MDPESGSQQATSGPITPRATDAGENAAVDLSTSSERGDQRQELQEVRAEPRPAGDAGGGRRPAEPRPTSTREAEPQAPAAPTLRLACELALSYLETLPSRPVGEQATLAELRARLGAPLGEEGVEPAAVLRDLAAGADPGLIGIAGPRYFGFVIGGSLPAALAADWLTSDLGPERRPLRLSPAAAVVEEIAAAWLLDLLGLPRRRQRRLRHRLPDGPRHRARRRPPRAPGAGRLGRRERRPGRRAAAARHGRRAGPRHDLPRAAAARPRHARDRAGRSPTARAGWSPRRSRGARPRRGAPTIVCAQAGNVNSGAFDPLGAIAALHAGTAPGCTSTARSACGRRPARGCGPSSPASSWPTPGRPTRTSGSTSPTTRASPSSRDPEAHRAAMTRRGLPDRGRAARRDPPDWTPEFSRRARGFAIYAALRSLGRAASPSWSIAAATTRGASPRSGRRARGRGPQRGRAEPGAGALPRPADGGSADDLTRAVIRRVQAAGSAGWEAPLARHGRDAHLGLQLVDDGGRRRAVAAAILTAAHEERGRPPAWLAERAEPDSVIAVPSLPGSLAPRLPGSEEGDDDDDVDASREGTDFPCAP